MKIYLVAGELSGDLLGASLIPALRQRYPNAEFRGLGGEKMQSEGLTSLYPLETLSIMGLVEVIKHLPKLIKVRKHLYQDALEWGADLMIGIDAPDFNLGLEKKLRAKGLKTVHYVSPSVWAWRQGRIKGIKKSCDLMLTLLPFEADFYQQHQMPVTFVGHPTADRLPLEPDRQQARAALGLNSEQEVIGLLPGSRGGEVSRLAPVFLQTAQRLQETHPDLVFLLPAATPVRQQQLEVLLQEYPVKNLQLLTGQADQVLQAANACLLASGTVTLEALFCKCPMTVSYKVAPLTWWMGKFLLKTPWVSLPNLLAQKELVPERLQEQATPEQLQADLQALLSSSAGDQQRQAFYDLHQQLQQNASQTAAEAIAQLMHAG
ncbi:lipid-A-disaccharide synthase [Marinospirillum celere]|uniref:Lipid-A-disaccharide synthase n=1 Tax=Marinospirillum celere TaxID=1122252 RepID=A0A1I1IXL3_9GAMM|nr:lipid-A-disaccharide synthase [Marinospirillum celere]SFC38443.1 lipid-A-disaccharide synthase [Marinospirillum celere]